VLDPEHPHTATALNNLAGLYFSLGDYTKAEPLYTRSIAISEKVLGTAHPNTVNALNNLAFHYGALNRLEEALALFMRGFKGQNSVISNISGIASESQLLKFVELSSKGYEGLMSLVHRKLSHDKKAMRQCLNAVLTRKGITLDIQSRQHQAMAETLDGKQAEAWVQLAAV
jgi:tetratricopeptide (TPR) repeat protein